MGTNVKLKVNALRSNFQDQLQAEYRGRAIIAGSRLYIRIQNKLCVLGLSAYKAPSSWDPHCPLLLRLFADRASGSVSSTAAWVLRKLDLPADSKPWPDDGMEFTILGEELPAATKWFVAWLNCLEENSTQPPQPTLELDVMMGGMQALYLEPGFAEAIDAQGVPFWESVRYLWSRAAKLRYERYGAEEEVRAEAWRRQHVERKEDEIVTLRLPVTRPKFAGIPAPIRFDRDDPEGVKHEVLNRFGTALLSGPRVEAELRKSAENGYIVLPTNYWSSNFWQAWYRTWDAFVNVPGFRRPRIIVALDAHPRAFGTRAVLEWDFMSRYPLNLKPGETRTDEDRAAEKRMIADDSFSKFVDEYHAGLSKAQRKVLFGKRYPHCSGNSGIVPFYAHDLHVLEQGIAWIAKHS